MNIKETTAFPFPQELSLFKEFPRKPAAVPGVWIPVALSV
jgi:hypothetical protein